jgi:hypothetical protein
VEPAPSVNCKVLSVVYVALSSPPGTEETGAMGHEVGSCQGECRMVVLKKKNRHI